MLKRLIINTVALILVFYFLWGIKGDILLPAIALAIALALLNAFVRPILIILTLPITVLTMGLFLVILNALLFWGAVQLLEHVFHFPLHIGFFKAFLGWLVFTLLSYLLSHLLD